MLGRFHERVTLDEALLALERTTGIRVGAVAYAPFAPGKLHRADALIELEQGEKRFPFVAEIKATVDRTLAVGHAKAHLQDLLPAYPNHTPLLVTRFMTPRMAENCRWLDLPFIDTAGNAYLRGPGLLVYVTGQGKPQRAEGFEYRANTQVGIKITFMLLCNPDWAAATQRDMARYADVALGAVGPVLKDLEDRDFIRKTRARGTILQNRRQLFDEWLMRYPEVLRPKLRIGRYQAEPERMLDADLPDGQVYWGGEKAAALMTGYLHPEQFTLYVRGQDPHVQKRFRLHLDARGNTELLRAFWTPELKVPDAHIAPAMLVYADLMNTGIARNVEAAKLVYERFIEHALLEK